MGVRIHVHVTPRSGRDIVEAGPGGELSVRVTAPPEDSKANVAVCKTVAKALGVPKGAVRVVKGETSRHKVLEVEGDEMVVRAALARFHDEGGIT
ncbi:MAG: DUF167 domain-containing protein [Coriobacteriia bacterium]|nr:DUF167 domain-containing protein [Coriobacteriia bacterium]